METRTLLHLVSVADAGSMSKAASLLGLTQPALSKSVRNAETRLGTDIFRRASSGLRPTAIGETIIVHARQALLTIEAIENEVQSRIDDETAAIRIGSGPTVVNQLIEFILPDFMAEYPQVNLDVISGNPHDLAQMVELGDLDMMLGFSENLEGSDFLVQRPLRRDPLSFFVSRRHPLSREGPIAPAELAPFVIALPFRTSKIDGWLEDHAAKGSHAAFRVMLCNDVAALTDLVETRLAVSIGPLPFIEQLATKRDITAITVEDFDFDRLLHCILPRGRPISTATRRLAAMIEDRLCNIGAPGPQPVS